MGETPRLKSKPHWRDGMKISLFVLLLFSNLIIHAQQPSPPQVVAGIPANYDEEKVGTYVLPELLSGLNGRRVASAKDWTTWRRAEILKLVEENQFGAMPPRPRSMTFDGFDKGTPAFGGKAIRKQVTIRFLKEHPDLQVDVLIYLPANAKGPVPLLLNISFAAYNQIIDDPGLKVGEIWTPQGQRVKADQPSRFGKMNVEQFIDAGFGFATLYYGSIEPDLKDGYKYGIRGKFLKSGETQPGEGEWGAISAWAWGLSRAMDYFETDRKIDSKRIAIQGASRLGKAVLWSGARDTRFKLVLASISGEGGAAISRRNYGETVGHISDPSRYYYWWVPKYHTYSKDVSRMPIDGHMLVALIAPRPLLLQTGNTDYWSDPKGEFVSAVAAEPVYKLFGERGPGTETMPAPGDTSLSMNKLGFYMHDGGHSVLPEDWKLFISYMKKYL